MGSTKLTVSVDLTKLIAGPFKKQAFVLYGGDPPTEQLELTFTGSMAARAYYMGRPVDFGPVRRETLAPRTVYLNPYLKGARLLEVVASDPLLIVRPSRDPDSGKAGSHVGAELREFEIPARPDPEHPS